MLTTAASPRRPRIDALAVRVRIIVDGLQLHMLLDPPQVPTGAQDRTEPRR
ncbi:hypothetical protein ACGFR8_31615 [Streptomyces brevispora]|uniref:hypothetical protein n=1 Tax=Streptomyces brevispora TaxID=887462 RepID=UPI003718A285